MPRPTTVDTEIFSRPIPRKAIPPPVVVGAGLAPPACIANRSYPDNTSKRSSICAKRRISAPNAHTTHQHTPRAPSATNGDESDIDDLCDGIERSAPTWTNWQTEP